MNQSRSTEPARFRDYAVHSFDAGATARELVSTVKPFKGKLSILFAGLCAWTVANHGRGRTGETVAHLRSARENEDLLVRSAMIRRMASGLEAHRKAKTSSPSVRKSLVALLIDKKFYRLFDYVLEPFGGLTGILDSCSKTEFETLLRRQSAGVDTVPKLMAIFHHYALFARNEKPVKRMSVESATDYLRELEERRAKPVLSTKMYRNHWNDHHPAATLIYAASLWETDTGSLLDLATTKVVQYNRRRALGWLRLAGQISAEVLTSVIRLPKQQRLELVSLPKLPACKLPPPPLSEIEQLWLTEKYRAAALDSPSLARRTPASLRRIIPNCKLQAVQGSAIKRLWFPDSSRVRRDSETAHFRFGAMETHDFGNQ